MTQWRELSRLPEAPEYWRGLQHRIAGAAAPVLAAQHARERRVDRWLAAGILAAAAGVAFLLLLPAPATDAGVPLAAGLAPADPLARELLYSTQPPAIGSLLVTYTGVER